MNFFVLSPTMDDIENKFSQVLLWLLNKIADLLNNVFGLLPDDPHFFHQLDFSTLNKFLEFIHYFIPFHFFISVIYLSVSLFLTIEIAFLIYKILIKAADKILASWSIFFS